MTFESLGLIEPILKALQHEGYETPTPIQARAIPLILEQRDILGCAQTGTGKTAAFALPVIQLLSENHPPSHKQKHIRALALTPTRELAIQINESFQAYGKFAHLTSIVVFGGVGQEPQTRALKKGVDVLIATPGRLLDLMNQGYVDLTKLDIFILDEADRMLDMGFIHDVKRVIAKIPVKRQTLFFSATMPSEIQKLSSSILTNPAKIEVTPPATTAEKIAQEIYYIDKNTKKLMLLKLLENSDMDRVLVFTRTKHGANKVVKDLLKEGITAEAIHGNKSQNARQLALRNFKDSKTKVLVATDIAARGIDVDDLAFVINYEIPNIPETYVHRIGRTGRAGASGKAISFCEEEEVAYIRDIQKLTGIVIPLAPDSPEPTVKAGQSGGSSGQSKSQHSRSQGQRNGQRSANSSPRSKGNSWWSNKRNKPKSQGN
jgi:ATP-dependent RNA helicase RhlE